MKQASVKRSPFEHEVTHAPLDLNMGTPYGAKCAMVLRNGKVVIQWRIYKRQKAHNGAKKETA